MRFGLSTLLVATFAIGLGVLTCLMIGRQPLWQIDYEAISDYSCPSDAEWEAILLAHADEIQDGSREPRVLNYEFVHGWQICVDYFCWHPNNDPNFPWDYDWIQDNYPGLHLGGPMEDTIRVSRSTGRKHTSAMIKNWLSAKSKQELVSRFYKFNFGYLGLAGGYLLLITYGISRARKRRITM